MVAPTFLPNLSHVSDGVELKWKLGGAQLDSFAFVESDPIYLQPLSDAAAFLVASLVRPAPFHALRDFASLRQHMCF